MFIVWAHCGTKSELAQKDQDFIDQMMKTGLKIVMVACPVCHNSTVYTEDSSLKPEIPAEDFVIRCPTQHCIGWVAHITGDNEDFFGCGECSNTWSTKEALDKDISRIIQKFSYRKSAYVKKKGGCVGAHSKEEDPNYVDLVEQEPFEISVST